MQLLQVLESWMSGIIRGIACNQSTLFPECLDVFLIEDGAVRLVDVYIDELDITGLGFDRT